VGAKGGIMGCEGDGGIGDGGVAVGGDGEGKRR
jgi:hypothetical protein